MIPNIYVPINIYVLSILYQIQWYRKIEWLLFEGKKNQTYTAINISVSESFEETSEGKKIRSEQSFPPLIF